MKTMKKFWKYFLNFLVLFLLVTGLTYWGTMIISNRNVREIECVAQNSAPLIEITEYSNKKVTGTVTNDTEALINLIYIRAAFYDEYNNLLGNEYAEIRFFNVGEKSKFEINCNYKKVSKIEVTASESKM